LSGRFEVGSWQFEVGSSKLAVSQLAVGSQFDSLIV